MVFEGESTFAIVNFGICLFTVVLYMWLAVNALFISTRVHSVERESLEKGYKKHYDSWWWLKDGMKQNSTFARHHVAIMYARDPILAACLVFGHDSPIFQIFSVVGIQFTSFLLYAYIRPFEKTLDNVVEVVNHFLFTAACLMFAILTLPLDLSERIKYDYIGWGAIAFFTILLLFNFSIIGYEIWQGMKDVWVRFKKWRAIRTRVVAVTKKIDRKQKRSPEYLEDGTIKVEKILKQHSSDGNIGIQEGSDDEEPERLDEFNELNWVYVSKK